MLRGIQKICSVRSFLQPRGSSRQLQNNYTLGKLNMNLQNLPKLPVPKLEDTLSKYLKTVKPFLSETQFAVTSKLVKEFAANEGRKLQELLEARAQKHSNWLEEWWLNTAYLEYRNPVVVYSSPGLVFPVREFKSQNDQFMNAAKTLIAAMNYKLLIDSDKIPLDKMGKSPLDMQQYKKIFGTCRLPGVKRDTLSYNSDSTHVTVMHNNNIFRLDLWGEDNVMLNEEQIVRQLQTIVANSKSGSPTPIGILTSENRDNWAKAYNILVKDNVNKESLKDIERSLAILCLDTAVGLKKCSSLDDKRNVAAGQTIHGGGSASNGGNRWFDKTIQFIVGADGVTGLTYEHSPAEGQPIAVMTDNIINYIEQNKVQKTSSSAKPKEPKLLKFNVNSEVAGLIKNAAENLDKLVADLKLNCFQFNKYGKNFIKSQKLSPDSYLQMAMQFAFYRLHKTAGAHYESAATRLYIGGRTETIRSCSIESVEFAKAMLNDKISNKEKVIALQKAINGHKDYTVQALQGLGVDRHLLGLKLAAIENGIEVPKLYSDAGYTKSAHMRLSTSQVACKCDGFMCYGPLVPDGYATCYNPRDKDINFATAAFNSNRDTSCDKYRAALEDSLQDMHNLLLHNTQSKL